MHIGLTLKSIMKKKDMRPKDIAAITQMGTQHVRNNFQKRDFRIRTLVRMCDALGYEVVVRRAHVGARREKEIRLWKLREDENNVR